MHYLILQDPVGHKLMGFSDHILDLHRELADLKRAGSGVPVIFSHDTLKNVYLCDDFGLPIQEEGWLLRLEDL